MISVASALKGFAEKRVHYRSRTSKTFLQDNLDSLYLILLAIFLVSIYFSYKKIIEKFDDELAETFLREYVTKILNEKQVVPLYITCQQSMKKRFTKADVRNFVDIVFNTKIFETFIKKDKNYYLDHRNVLELIQLLSDNPLYNKEKEKLLKFINGTVILKAYYKEMRTIVDKNITFYNSLFAYDTIREFDLNKNMKNKPEDFQPVWTIEEIIQLDFLKNAIQYTLDKMPQVDIFETLKESSANLLNQLNSDKDINLDLTLNKESNLNSQSDILQNKIDELKKTLRIIFNEYLVIGSDITSNFNSKVLSQIYNRSENFSTRNNTLIRRLKEMGVDFIVKNISSPFENIIGPLNLIHVNRDAIVKFNGQVETYKGPQNFYFNEIYKEIPRRDVDLATWKPDRLNTVIQKEKKILNSKLVSGIESIPNIFISNENKDRNINFETLKEDFEKYNQSFNNLCNSPIDTYIEREKISKHILPNNIAQIDDLLSSIIGITYYYDTALLDQYNGGVYAFEPKAVSLILKSIKSSKNRIILL